VKIFLNKLLQYKHQLQIIITNRLDEVKMKASRFLSIIFSILSATVFLALFYTAQSPVTASSEIHNPSPTTTIDASNSVWRILADMQVGRGDPGIVGLNNKIHVISGFFTSGYGYSSSQEIYDPLTNTWQLEWGFPNPRSDMVTEIVGDKIYAIGGWNVFEGGIQDYNHRYDPSDGTWTMMTSMDTPVSGAAGVVLSDTIYVIGGFDGTQITTHVQIYDPTTDSWSYGTPMSIPRSEHEAVVVDGLVYVIGGTLNINDVEIYNPMTDEWSNGPSLPETRFSIAVIERLGNIYVIGGSDTQVASIYKNTVFVYDPSTGLWSSLDDPLPTARGTCDAAVISDTIYVIGGIGDPGAGTANEAYGDFEPLSTTTQIVSVTPNPSMIFEPVVVSFQVTSSLFIPTGVVTVTVDQNNVECSELLTSAMGSCEITLDTPGIYTLTAIYSGDDFHYSSSNSVDHTVTDVPVTGLAAMNSGPVTLGAAAVFTATVDAGTNISYTWDFGDQTFDSGQTVSHIYSAAGTYTANVTAQNGVSDITISTEVIVQTKIFLPYIIR
jgi:hypothetical protein